jgi:hypothetical protein
MFTFESWLQENPKTTTTTESCLIIYCFTSRSRIFHLYGDVTITGEGRSGPSSRDGFLSCHTYCDKGPRFFRSLPKDRPIQSPLTTHKGVWRIYSNPEPHGNEVQPRACICKYMNYTQWRLHLSVVYDTVA